MGSKHCDTRKDKRRVTLPGNNSPEKKKKKVGGIFFSIILFKVSL